MLIKASVFSHGVFPDANLHNFIKLCVKMSSEEPRSKCTRAGCPFYCFENQVTCSQHFYEDNPHIQRPPQAQRPRSICYFLQPSRGGGFNAECIGANITTPEQLNQLGGPPGSFNNGPVVTHLGLYPCQACWDRYQAALLLASPAAASAAPDEPPNSG